MARLIELMSHDDRVALLRRLPAAVVEAICLRLVDEADRRDIANLFKYAENTAGAIMTTDYAWLPANITTAKRSNGSASRPRIARRSTTSTCSTNRRGGCSAFCRCAI